jgi:hypothetical protein
MMMRPRRARYIPRGTYDSTCLLICLQVQEGFIVDEDVDEEGRAERRMERKKRRREEREREEEHLDEEDLELIGEHDPAFQRPAPAEVCKTFLRSMAVANLTPDIVQVQTVEARP